MAAAVAALAVAGLAGGLREARSAYRKASLPFAVSLEPGLHELSEQRARELRLEGRAPAAAPAQPGAGTFVTSGARYQASRLSASGPQTGSVPVPVADVALPAPARPPPRETRLAAGRPVEWWRDRLRLLATRSDEEGRRLLALTRERAVANGLEVVDGALGAEVRFAAKVVGP